LSTSAKDSYPLPTHDLEKLIPDSTLERRLEAALADTHPGVVRVQSRDLNSYSSTFPTEVVTCTISGAAPIRLFCKHFRSNAGRHPRKTADPFYEIKVYRHVLSAVPLSVPQYLGAWTDDESGNGLLVIENLEESRRVTKTDDQRSAFIGAARWIGEFHKYCASILGRPNLDFLTSPDADFYVERANQLTVNFESQPKTCAWLRLLSDRFEEVLHLVRDSVPTIIHGEYYSQNILVRHNLVYPVDWETARIGMGELDLAMLLEGWSDAMVNRCVRAYHAARGDASDESAVRRRLCVARIFVNVYWLSSFSDAPPWRLDHLRHSAQELGILR
jgi:thiamine kinase-like enzyme